MPNEMIDWYEERHQLRADMVFMLTDGSVIQLDRRVPGDGTEWYALEWMGERWVAEDLTVHPGDFVEQLPDTPRGQSPAVAREKTFHG